MKARWTHVVTLLCAPAAAGALAPHCATWHWSLDLLACFPVQSFAALLCACAAFLIGRKWLPAAVCAGLATVAGSAILPGWLAPNNYPQSVGNTPQIRVLTLNLLHSNELGGSQALEVIRELAPDLIWCAEFTSSWQKLLSRELPEFPHRCLHPTDSPFGAALYSRYPIEPAAMMPLGHSWTPACRAVVRTPFGPIGFLGVHPPPPGLSHRRTEERNLGLLAIPKALENLPARRIVAGDFNTTPWNASFPQLRAASSLSAGTTTTWLPTWPANLPALLRVPIDHILVAGKLKVASCQLGANFGSDHLPLFAVIEMIE
jgi:endonuclease/exonuclease/phosphatase (EEP) superfamily protein YafD